MNIATIDLKNIIRHPEIGQLYELSVDIVTAKIYAELSDEMLIFMQKNNPLHVVKGEGNQYYFFSNWGLLVELRSRGIKKVTAVVHKKMTADEIIEWAYRSEITKWLPSLKDASQFKYLQSTIDQSPLILKKMFKGRMPKTSASAIQKLAALTRSQTRTKLESKVKKASALESFLGKSNG